MAAVDESCSPGEKEGDDSKMSFEEWLLSRKISKKTCNVLIEGGINTRYLICILIVIE